MDSTAPFMVKKSTYSFISPACYDKIGWAPDEPLRDSLKILNPLGEDTSIMRSGSASKLSSAQ